jgi:hypothetical protein
MKTQRTLVTWLASSLIGAVALVGVGSGFASTSVVTSASGVSQTVGFGAAGSLQAQVPCPADAVNV